MHFEDTQTFKNLARSFAGECQAGMRYQFIAKQAKEQDLKILSDTIKSIAKNEAEHARVFFEELTLNGKFDNINIDAGYPFRTGSLIENLQFAMEDEKNEQKLIYPEFQKIASSEGFERIANIFGMVADVERQHESIFKYLAISLKEDKLYKADAPTLWVCSQCGHRATNKDAWQICPLCHFKQGFVDIHLPYESSNYNTAGKNK